MFIHLHSSTGQKHDVMVNVDKIIYMHPGRLGGTIIAVVDGENNYLVVEESITEILTRINK
jgi:hypothetical protein